MRWIALLLLTATASAPGSATTYTIPGYSNYIQPALDAAANGDSVVITVPGLTGALNRNLDFHGKAITLRSASGDPAQCYLDAQAQGRLFHLDSGESNQAIIEGLRLRNGSATHGGGAYIANGSAPQFRNCIFESNRATNGPGGAVSSQGGSPTFIDCRFVGNVSWHQDGGAVSCEGMGPATFVGCDFEDNEAESAGGAINSEWSDPVFIECTFRNHHAQFGAVVYCMNSPMSVSHCSFVDSWTTTFGEGGAFYCVGSNARPEIEHSLFVRCTAGMGGAFYIRYGADVALRNCTFVYCHTEAYATVEVHDSNAILENCILAFATEGAGVECRSGGAATLSCCDIYGNYQGDWAGSIASQYGQSGNISADPIFCDPAGDDFTIASYSPCAPFSHPNPECDLIGGLPIGCGTSSVAPGGPQIAGLSRIVPNPTRGATQLFFTLDGARGSATVAEIYDPSGRLVRRLQAESNGSGTFVLPWDGRDVRGQLVPGGVYLVRVSADGFATTRSIVVVR